MQYKSGVSPESLEIAKMRKQLNEFASGALGDLGVVQSQFDLYTKTVDLYDRAQTDQIVDQIEAQLDLKRDIADSYSVAQTDAAIDANVASALLPYRTIADSYSIATADATFAPRNRLRSTGSVQDQIIVNANDIQMKINNINLMLMVPTDTTFYFPILLSGAADTAPTANSVVSRQYVDDAVAGGVTVPTRILAVGQLYEAFAENTGVSVAYNAFNIATFEESQITLYQPVSVSGAATTITDPFQLVYKGYVDSLNADTLLLFSDYRTIADSYSAMQVDTEIGNALVPYRLIADSYTQSEVDALIAGVSGGGFTDRIQSTNGNLLQVDTSKLLFTMGGIEKMRVQSATITVDAPLHLQGDAVTVTGASQVVPRSWIESNYYDKPYIDALPSNLSTVYTQVITTVTSGTDYVITHGLNTALENLLVELTLEIKTADADIPMAIGDRFKITYDNYNGETPQVGYGVAIKSSSVNSVLVATQIHATLVSFFANESTGSPAYSPIEWSRVKLHIHISTRNATSYQQVDFSAYTPTYIQGTGLPTSLTQYTGNALTSTASSMAFTSENNLTLTSQTGTVTVNADFEFKVEAPAGADFFLSEPGVASELVIRGPVVGPNEFEFQVNSALSTARFDMYDVPLVQLVMPTGLFFELKGDVGTGRLNGDFTVETLIETAPSSFEYKEYSYCVAKETTPSFCDIKKGVPQCNGYEQYHPRSANLPRLIKFRYSEAFCKALGKSQKYIDAREFKEGWLWEDVNASYPELCTTQEAVNKETGIAYTQKMLNVKGLQLMLLDALIEKVMRLEYAVSQITGESKMW